MPLWQSVVLQTTKKLCYAGFKTFLVSLQPIWCSVWQRSPYLLLCIVHEVQHILHFSLYKVTYFWHLLLLSHNFSLCKVNKTVFTLTEASNIWKKKTVKSSSHNSFFNHNDCVNCHNIPCLTHSLPIGVAKTLVQLFSYEAKQIVFNTSISFTFSLFENIQFPLI